LKKNYQKVGSRQNVPDMKSPPTLKKGEKGAEEKTRKEIK